MRDRQLNPALRLRRGLFEELDSFVKRAWLVADAALFPGPDAVAASLQGPWPSSSLAFVQPDLALTHGSGCFLPRDQTAANHSAM